MSTDGRQETGGQPTPETVEAAQREAGQPAEPARRIVRLAAENVKRLSAVEIEPDGNLVIVGGVNGAGKSSVLDSIMYALAGTRSIPTRPIRTGTDSGRIELDLDGDPPLKVIRRLSPSGGSLEIRNAEGFKASSPQKILDELCGKVAFDPLAFTRKSPRDQADALRELVGIDFSEVDAARKRLYEERAEVNRESKRLAAQIGAIEVPEGTPDEEGSVAALLEKLKGQEEENKALDRQGEKLKNMRLQEDARHRRIQTLRDRVDEIEAQMARLREEMARVGNAIGEEREALKGEVAAREALAEQVATSPRIDTSATEAEIAAAETVNTDVRRKQERKRLTDEYIGLCNESTGLSENIDEIDAHKAATLAEAEWPVDGLGFDAEGVTLNGLPFEQASSAEQLRVSVAMGLALNPTLRVLLIRDGSLLDAESLRIVAELAKERDGQVWLERVSEGSECSVVIEDGHVKDSHTTAAPAA